MTTRRERAEQVLRALLNQTPDAVDAIVVSPDGTVVAAIMVDRGQPIERIGAIIAAVGGIGRKSSSDMGNGLLEHTVIRGSEGYAILVVIPGISGCFLLLTAIPSASLGIVLAEAREAALTLQRIV